MSLTKSSRAEVIAAAGELEQLLQRLGARGRGLTEKAQSVASHLPRDVQQDLGRVARARNDAVHNEAHAPVDARAVQAAERAKAALSAMTPFPVREGADSTRRSWRRYLPVLQGQALLVWLALFASLHYAASLGIERLTGVLAQLEWRAPGSLAQVLQGVAALLLGYLSFAVARNLMIAAEDGLTERATLHQVAAIAAALLLVPFAALSTPGAIEFYRGLVPFALVGTLAWAAPTWWLVRRRAT